MPFDQPAVTAALVGMLAVLLVQATNLLVQRIKDRKADAQEQGSVQIARVEDSGTFRAQLWTRIEALETLTRKQDADIRVSERKEMECKFELDMTKARLVTLEKTHEGSIARIEMLEMLYRNSQTKIELLEARLMEQEQQE